MLLGCYGEMHSALSIFSHVTFDVRVRQGAGYYPLILSKSSRCFDVCVYLFHQLKRTELTCSFLRKLERTLNTVYGNIFNIRA